VKTVARTPPAPGALRCERRADDTLLVHLVGPWTICDFNYKMAQIGLNPTSLLPGAISLAEMGLRPL